MLRLEKIIEQCKHYLYADKVIICSQTKKTKILIKDLNSLQLATFYKDREWWIRNGYLYLYKK